MNTNLHKTIGQISITLAGLLGLALPNETHAQFTGNNQTNVISGVTSNWTGNYYVGQDFVFDALFIKNAGVLSNGTAYIGYAAGANSNTAVVSGPGSVWKNEDPVFGDLYVGYSGAGNSLVVSNQGKVVTSSGYLGYNANSSNNSVTVTGSGSTFSNLGALIVGFSGSGNGLLLTNRGEARNNNGYIGYYAASSNNVVSVSGAGSVLECSKFSSYFYIGYSGSSNRLLISNQGLVLDAYAIIGRYGNNNTVWVTGPGSVWSNYFGALVIGDHGWGNSVIVSNQGKVFTHGTVGIGASDASASNNFAVVTGSGSTWQIFDAPLYVGGSGGLSRLVITSGGKVINNFPCIVAQDPRSIGNSVLVTGSGSVWSNDYGFSFGVGGAGNSLVISNQGAVVNEDCLVGSDASSSNNTVVVTGAGSIWTNRSDLWVGVRGPGNLLVITNGGKVFNREGYLGSGADSSNNTVRVLNGGVWQNRSTLYVGGGGSANLLTIAGGSVLASSAFIGGFGTASNNVIRVDSGSLFLTNATGDGALVVSQAGGKGELILNGGVVTVDKIVATNDVNSVVTFNGGTLHTKATAVTNNQQFVVGNASSAANYHLRGGVHSFNDGLRIRTNSFLTGCGTINGEVLIDPGGAVHANCNNLVFNSSVTNNGAIVADGAVLEGFGRFVNNGKIFLLHGGTTNFHGTFINNGQILSGDIRLAIERDGSGGFFIRFTGAPDVAYRFQRAASVTGTWNNLATKTAPPSGLIEYHDTSPPPGQAFYRTVQP